jgi:hypothetical protein
VLPNITFLYLVVTANGHAFGASSFHALRLCNGIKRLAPLFSAPIISEVKLSFRTGQKLSLVYLIFLIVKKRSGILGVLHFSPFF